MRKEVLLALGAALVVIGVTLGLLLLWTGSTEERELEPFFRAIENGRVEELMALFHPSLSEQVDPPILRMWMETVRERLGAYQGLDPEGFRSRTEMVEGGLRSEQEGTARFALGRARFSLVRLEDRIIEFEVRSDRVQDWFREPDPELYRERAAEFLTALMNGWETEAFAMMHPKLQQVMPLERLRKDMTGVRSQAGRLLEIRPLRHRFEVEGLPTLEIWMEIRGDRDTASAPVRFQFDGLRGHILGFHITFD